MMKKFYLQSTFKGPGLWIPILLIIIIYSSCTVTNNLYINDPFPLPRSEYEFYGGAGMGLKPKIDSVSRSGEVFSHSLAPTGNLNFGGRIAVTSLFDISFGVHLPEVVGGAGATLRPQLSMYPYPSKFNIAFAADLGFVIAEDSVRFLGDNYISFDDKTRGAINADFSLPIGHYIGKDTRLIITPRYSFNTFYMRKDYDISKSKRFNISYPALSLGLRKKNVQLEATVAEFNGAFKYLAGIVIFFGRSSLGMDE